MKSHKLWSYSPYCPPFWDGGDIYICRIAPGKDFIHFEVLNAPKERYEVLCRKRGEADFLSCGSMTGTEFDITGLLVEEDYEFMVTEGERRSRIRLARTGESFGVVVNYLHPDDEVYSFSGRYLCSPSVIRLESGALLVSMDLFEGTSPQNLSLIFRSDDNGLTWHYVTELFPCFWGKLFIHRGDVYMLSCSTEYGDVLLGRSTDEGKTFCEPSVLFRGSNGKHGEAGMHRNPQPVVYRNGRIWNTIEYGSWGRGYHAPMVISAPEDADLLDADSWVLSDPIKYDPTWPGLPEGVSSGVIEGSLVDTPDGHFVNIMRYDMSKMHPNYGKALVFEVFPDEPERSLSFMRTMDFPANHSKFTIKYDEVSGCYVTIATRIIDEEHSGARNLLSFMYSHDLVTWEVGCDIYNKLDCNPYKVGFQYVDYLFDGEDLLFICRTGWNQPHNYHDANYSICDRVKSFRSLIK